MSSLKNLVFIFAIGILLAGSVTAAAVWQSTGWITNGATISATKIKAHLDYLKDQIKWVSNGSNIYYNTGNVGLGDSTPEEKLDVVGNLQISGDILNDNNTGYIYIAGGTTNARGGNILLYGDGYSTSAYRGGMAFRDGTAVRMRIRGDSGYVGIGTSSPSDQLHVQGGGNTFITVRSPSGKHSGINIYEGSSRQWSLSNNANNNRFYVSDQEMYTGVYLPQDSGSWRSTSDRRLKKNIKELLVLDKLDDYTVVSFDWKVDGRHDIGVIAQDIYKIFPEVVSVGVGDEDGIGPVELGNEWGVDYAKLGALALQAIKELKEENNKLRIRIEVLEAKLSN